MRSGEVNERAANDKKEAVKRMRKKKIGKSFSERKKIIGVFLRNVYYFLIFLPESMKNENVRNKIGRGEKIGNGRMKVKGGRFKKN